MDLTPFFQSVLEQDPAPIVLCDRNHTIVYLNPAAASRYADCGGYDLVGRSLLSCHNERSNAAILKVLSWFAESPRHNRVHTVRNEKACKDVYMVALRDSGGALIGYYEQHAFRAWDTEGLYQLTSDKE